MTGPATLSSERLRFRNVAKGDAAALFHAWSNDGDTVRFLQWRPHGTVAEAEAFFERLEEATAKKEKSYYVVSDTQNTDVGFASLKIEDGCRAIIGFIVFRPFRGRGYASEIIRTLCDWCLSAPEIFRVYALCDIENHASKRAMEKAGLTAEGVLRRWAVHPNISSEPRDVISFAKTKASNQHLKATEQGKSEGKE
jgi:[ribosomal protein S5]-alanine N-acetyltransferase